MKKENNRLEAPAQESVFLKACRHQPTPYTPVWLMRQAGRYMKDYRDLRAKLPFLSICKNKDLASEITVTAQQKLNTDAAIIFADILLIVEPFGLSLDYPKGDGPTLRRLVRGAADVDRLPEPEPAESLAFVTDAVSQTRKALRPEVALIGFAGAPFTLASYMIEGGASQDFSETRKMMLGDAGVWKAFMEKIARATVKYLNAQIDAGAQAVQLFDSWVGCLSEDEYRCYVMPYSSQVLSGVRGGVPVIHFGTGNKHFLECFSQAGGNVVGVDHRVRLDEAWQRVGHDRAVQGNLDPIALFGPIKDLEATVRGILAQAGGRPGHIFNLGHGVLPETPEENAIALVEMVHEFSRR